MSNQSPGRPNSMFDNESSEEGGSSFDWEFVNDDSHSGPRPMVSPRLVEGASPRRIRYEIGGRTFDEKVEEGNKSQFHERQAFRQESTGGQANKANNRKPILTASPSEVRLGAAHDDFVRDQLDQALDRWWTVGEIPSLLLLRDGLQLLEAGGSAAESQRTLLLRAALAYNKGIQTALRYQVDAERVALVLAEALVEWTVPLDPERLPVILVNEAQVQSLLVEELERRRILLNGEPRRRAQVALNTLRYPTKMERATIEFTTGLKALMVSRRRPLRQILLILLLLALIGFALWQQGQRSPDGMVAMPGATYGLVKADGQKPMESVRLDAFFIDRFEVTNRDYRTCVEQGACKWPVRTASMTRSEYFTNPAFDKYPVVYVTHAMAANYCAWEDKRLPSSVEWQVAASVSPNTGHSFRYPWGEDFESQRTNSASSKVGDTLVVGSYRPGGDSSSGASDMAGNVAEWTATLVVGPQNKSLVIVKGGSFASGDTALLVDAEMLVKAESALPDVGFRCARTYLIPES